MTQENGRTDGGDESTSETPEVYETRHIIEGQVPVWAHVAFWAGREGELPSASGYETEDTIDDVEARLSCICGEEPDTQSEALDHLREKAGEVIEVREHPDGETEVLGVVDPEGGEAR